MRSLRPLSYLKLSTALLAATLTTACSNNYHYKDYQGEWAPELMKPYDLSDNTIDAPVVYFATIKYRALGVPFHRLLLATAVDDQPLPGAGRRSILDVSGMQALKLTPGKHSLAWCWVSMNALGTGGATASVMSWTFRLAKMSTGLRGVRSRLLPSNPRFGIWTRRKWFIRLQVRRSNPPSTTSRTCWSTPSIRSRPHRLNEAAIELTAIPFAIRQALLRVPGQDGPLSLAHRL